MNIKDISREFNQDKGEGIEACKELPCLENGLKRVGSWAHDLMHFLVFFG